MTNFNEKLDDVVSLIGVPLPIEQAIHAKDTAKQAILHWVADLVGEEIAINPTSTRDGMAQVYGENMLKREIREKLKA